MLPKIYADFHNLDNDNRIRLTAIGTQRDLQRLEIQLTDGMALTLYMDDADDDGNPDEIMIDSVAHYSSADNCWVAIVDWATVYHASEHASRNSSNGGPSKHRATS